MQSDDEQTRRLIGMAKPTGIESELQNAVLAPMLMLSMPGFNRTGFLPFAAPHTLLCLSGAFLVVCMHHEALEGFSYSAKRSALADMRAVDLVQAANDRIAIQAKQHIG